MTGKIVPVILSGGSGTRLWPLSTDEKPKQFLDLTSHQSMFADTLARVSDAKLFGPPIIVGAARHAPLIEAELPAHLSTDVKILLEPCPRNTAPAIALAALAAGGGDALILVMPSDHVIADLPAFLVAVETASAAAQEGWLVTFAIDPTGPETGFGYIRQGQAIEEAPGVFQADAFIEKPDLEIAEVLFDVGGHGWNAGIFLMRADSYLAALDAQAPRITEAVRAAFDKSERLGRLFHIDEDSFATAPSDSIDYAVMEKHGRVATIPVSCGWSDVGSWDAMAGLGPADADGNRLHGDVIALNSANSLIRADGITVTASNVHDLIIVANRDHVMVVPRGSSQDVKAIVDTLKNKPV